MSTLTLRDRAIVRDLVVRTRLGIATVSERGPRDSLGARRSTAPDVSRLSDLGATETAPPRSETADRCIYCGARTRFASLVCGPHDDLLELDDMGPC